MLGRTPPLNRTPQNLRPGIPTIWVVLPAARPQFQAAVFAGSRPRFRQSRKGKPCENGRKRNGPRWPTPLNRVPDPGVCRCIRVRDASASNTQPGWLSWSKRLIPIRVVRCPTRNDMGNATACRLFCRLYSYTTGGENARSQGGAAVPTEGRRPRRSAAVLGGDET